MPGGTSNHFRRAALEAADGWDAWNVTEDADLGLRLARAGCRVGMIAPPEELRVWLAQRSRWLKGFVQTCLVVMRRPGEAMRELGLAGFAAMQLTLGAAILSALVHGPWAIWLALSLMLPEAGPAPVFLAVAAVSYAEGMSMALAATLPVYWPLQSIAMVRALYGLAKCPHFWTKTPHTVHERAA